MEFYDGFTWALPKAFKYAIASCTFDQGDTLYNTKLAYGKWGEVVDKIDHAIQVHSSTVNASNSTTEDVSSVFRSNWNNTVKIEFIIGGGPYNKNRFLSTTQGRLFTLLREGNLEILNTDNENPLPPLLSDSLKTHLKDSDIIKVIKQHIIRKYDKPNLVIMAYDETNDLLVGKYNSIINCLHEFIPNVIDFSLHEFAFLKSLDFHPALSIKTIVIDSNSPEKIRDRIKEVLWPKRDPKNATKSFRDIITRTKSSSANPFKLENHVIFTPFQVNKFGDIRVHSFNHSPFYRYRLHNIKIDGQNNIPKSLKNYLNLVFTNCPNHLFVKSVFRVSKTNINIDIELLYHEDHILIKLAKESRKFNNFKSRHENLEQYFLDNDRGTIAVELPLWIEDGELKDFTKIFDTREALTGHIDILRIEDDGKIAIWDYKPNAYKETKAHVQVFLYAYMLSVRTGIKLSNFVCGYFDEVDLYQFNPSEVIVDYCKNTTMVCKGIDNEL